MVEMDLTYFTYEQFCSNPADCISELTSEIPTLSSVDVNKRIKVKDYPLDVIVNHNARQIGNLSQQEIDAISEILKTDSELVKFMNYDPDKIASV